MPHYKMDAPGISEDEGHMLAHNVDEEPLAPHQRESHGKAEFAVVALCVAYTAFHILVMNLYPLETWTYRMLHLMGGLVIGYLTYSAVSLASRKDHPPEHRRSALEKLLLIGAGGGVSYGLAMVAVAWFGRVVIGQDYPEDPLLFQTYGPPLLIGVALAIVCGWRYSERDRGRIYEADWILGLAALAMTGYILFHVDGLRLRAGTGMAQTADLYAALVGVLLILELTRRVAGLALVLIVGVFIGYAFLGPYLPGFLYHRGYSMERFFTYIFTDQGILGDPIAVSSTYIILFVVFAAFLQASRVGDYFVNFAFAVAGRSRGGPAKVAVFSSALMGTINGTSAGNVVATGSLTIPLMKRVGYSPKSAGAIEATASSGGQILPPIMGAGAFIMAEVTGIPYSDIAIAAIIPALLYFVSIFFMIDLQALKLGMKGLPKESLPELRRLARQIYLFVPIVILVYALFAGYSVIRAGTLAMAAAAVVSWFTPYKMTLPVLLKALENGAKMCIQMVAVCAAAGIIVGVIALTGVGARFSTILLGLAEHNQLIALFFAMCIAVVLGMGMPTTAAYAVAAAVVAPGLIQMGIEPLVAHFFVFYFAVMSAITPPVALAAYAGAGLAGSDPLKTSVEAFRLGLAAFIVPFMFFYSPELLMQGAWYDVLRVVLTACLGMYLLAAAIQGYLFGVAGIAARVLLFVAAVMMIEASVLTDVAGAGIAAVLIAWQRLRKPATQPVATPSEA